jgi:hypothetical protein
MTMPEETNAMREELAALRAELSEIQLEHRKILRLLGVTPLSEGEEWPRYLSFDASCLAVRHDEKQLPIIMRADENRASLIFMDKQNCVRAEFIIDDAGFRIETRNSQHQLTFQLSEAEDGTGQLCVCDAEGKPRAGMRVNESGGVVNVVDPHGKPQAVLLAQPSGGEIFVVNAMHRAGVTLRASEVGGQVLVHEPSGQLMGHFSATNDMGVLSVYGEHGSMAATLAGSGEGGRLAFHDLDGAVESVLPER